MDVVSLVQLFPPQHQLRFECPHVGFHVRDEQLQVKCLCSTTKFIIIKFVKLRADISEEAEPTEPNLVRELLKALEVLSLTKETSNTLKEVDTLGRTGRPKIPPFLSVPINRSRPKVTIERNIRNDLFHPKN